MRFQPTSDLKNKYAHSSKDRNIAIYYNVKDTAKGKAVMMAVQNIGKIYMQNLVINYDDCCQSLHKGPGTRTYKNLGNLKNKTHKTMTLNIPSKSVRTVNLDYTFTPVAEDSFLMKNDDYASSASQIIRGRIILYIND